MAELPWDAIPPADDEFFRAFGPTPLLIGAGGGGDVCGCLPLCRRLQELGMNPRLGSLTWERSVVIPAYGPTDWDGIQGMLERQGRWGLAGPTMTSAGAIPFQAARIAGAIGSPVIVLDLCGGVEGLVESAPAFFDAHPISSVCLLDVGGDILTRGTEEHLHSPLADATVLAAFARLEPFFARMEVPVIVGVFALGCDGELRLPELHDYLDQFVADGTSVHRYRHTDRELDYLEEILAESGAVTEASAQPLLYRRGQRGWSPIRGGERQVFLTEVVLNTFFLPLRPTYEHNAVAQLIADTASIVEGSTRLVVRGIPSEYESERLRFEGEVA